MNKNILGITAAIVICVVLVGAFFLFKNDDTEKKNAGSNNSSAVDKDNSNVGENKVGDGKVLIVYYSATNNTKRVAEQIAENLNGDLFEIEPKEEYTQEDLNWNDSNSRVSKEHDDAKLRDVELKTTKVDNWDEYETVIIGYPIWWGIAAWPVDSFVKAQDFTGKTVIPFCTSSSSGLGESGKLLADEAKGGNWLDGQRFSSRPSESDIKTFTDGL